MYSVYNYIFKINLYFLIIIYLKDEEDINESGQIITTPIPKPLVGKGQFANLHLNLNLEKSVYESYRVNTNNNTS